MENTNLIDKKNGVLICGWVFIFLMARSFVVYANQPQFPADFKVSEYFSFFGSGGIDWQALSDANNNPILVACIKGIADESLEILAIPDVQQRLERLERGNLIKKSDGRYILTFPAIVGDKRDKLREYAKQAAQQILPSAEKTIAQIRPNLAGRDEMLYHVLWSVVMDGGPAWDAARAEMNKKIDAGDTSTENKAWLLYPSHPFQAGTNSWNNSSGHLKVTWSRNTPSPNAIGRVISQYAAQLTQATEQDRAVESADAKGALGKYGLIDEAGKARLYTIKADSEATKSYAELGAEFGRQIMTQLDAKKVAEMLDVSPGVAFVIAYHEISWQLLQDLSDKKVLEVPQIVAQAGTKTTDAYQLVSLTLIKAVKDPLPKAEMSAEEAKAIEEYRRIKAQILDGESYKDTSTPLHAVLTHLSSLGQGQTKDYFMGLDILRAPLPPAEPQEASLWPVFAGETELADTFVLVYSKGRWIWIGNMGSNYDWNTAKSAFEKWAREKITPVQAAEKQLHPHNKLIAWYRLDEADGNDVADSSGNNNVGMLAGNPQWRPAGGKVGGALELDGDGDYVLIGNESAFGITGPISIAAWIKVNSFDKRWQALVTKGDTAWRLQRTAEENTLSFHCTGITSITGQRPEGIEGTKNVNDGQWHHAVGVYDGVDVSLYIDGVLDNSSKAPGTIRTNDSAVIIGGNSEQADREWNGMIDEVCIFACALGANNVSALYSGTNPIKVAQEAPTPNEPTLNRVLSLDGQNDCVRVADSQSLHSFSNAITIEVWSKASSFYAGDGEINSIIRKNVMSGAENFLLRFRNAGGKPKLEMGLGNEIGELRASQDFAAETWYHIAGTYDGNTITVFVNGLAIESRNIPGKLLIDQSDLYIGKGDPTFSSGEYFHGVLDEIRLWNVARSQEQIRAAMNTPLTGKEDGLVAYWDFDDGTAKDLSGHGNDGILSGDARIVESSRPVLSVSGEKEPGKVVAWWRFENDANDSIGANDGTVRGDPTYVDGKFGRAISFDGDDYVDCGNPDSLNFGTGDWTISAWIKTTQAGTEPENRGTIFANGGDEPGGIRYALAVNEEYLGTIVLTTDDDKYKVQAMGKTVVNDGNWHHVVGMRNAGQLRVDVDGALDGGSYLSDGYDLSGTSQHNAYIGVITDHRDNSLYKYFVGLIDELCIFAGAIDANGVCELYSGEDPMKVAQTSISSRASAAAPREAVAVAQQQLQNVTPGTGNIVVALILVLALAGVVGGIVFFLVKSSIR